MDNLVWRIRVKVVAYIDMVLLCLFLLACIILGAIVTAKANIDNDPKTKEKFHGISNQGIYKDYAENVKSTRFKVWIVWAIVAVFAVFLGLQMWATIKLLGSAEFGAEPAAALRKARIWKTVTIVIFVLAVIADLIFASYVSLAITAIWRGSALLVVHNFTKELKSFTIIQSSGSSGINAVDVIIK